MTFVLLTGAGFSRNWGGWLANEAFEYLLGCSGINGQLQAALWKHRNEGRGYEDALSDFQLAAAEGDIHAQRNVKTMQSALISMFNLMDKAFGNIQFESTADLQRGVTSFLARFDAIFTLNQDLLLERHYLRAVELSTPGRWGGGASPGIGPAPTGLIETPLSISRAPRQPLSETEFSVPSGIQPYFKLHGSQNWQERSGEHVLIVGGNKGAAVDQVPLLKWYRAQFVSYLSRPSPRLMIVGYSFNDDHINQALIDAASARTLRIFIIDPFGADVIDKRERAASIPQPPTPLMNALQPYIIGASRRSLRETFGNDFVEWTKVMRFFE